MGKEEEEPTFEELIEKLKDEDNDIKLRNILKLGELGDQRAVKPLIKTLQDKDYRIRRRAAEALGKLGDQRAVETLLQVFKYDIETLYDLLNWIGQLYSEKGIDMIYENLREIIDEDYFFLEEILDYLEKHDKNRLIVEFNRMLSDVHTNISASDVESLTSVVIKINDQRVYEAYINLINGEPDEEYYTPYDDVKYSLQEISNELIIEPLIKQLNNANPRVRYDTSASTVLVDVAESNHFRVGLVTQSVLFLPRIYTD